MKLFVDGTLIANDLVVANKFFQRLKGLMFKESMGKNEAMMIPKCNWVHTMFMRFPIDIVYLNSDNAILSFAHDVKPWRICLPRLKAEHTLELASGTVKNRSLRSGGVIKCIA